MYRYEIILQDSEDWIDCFTVFGYDEDAAIEEAEEQAIWAYGMEPDKIVGVEVYAELIDFDELCPYSFDDDSDMEDLVMKIANNFEEIILGDCSFYGTIQSCINNISCLIDYAHVYLHKESRRHGSYTKRDLTNIVRYIFEDIDDLCGYINRHELSDVINAVNKIYVNYAARAVYNYEKRGT